MRDFAPPRYGSRGGFMLASFRASEWPSLKATTPVLKCLDWSTPSYPPPLSPPFVMQDEGHQRLPLHIKSDFGMASERTRFSAGLTIALRLNSLSTLNWIPESL